MIVWSHNHTPSVNRKDLHDLTLVGPPRDNPEQETLDVLNLDNRQFILLYFRASH